MSSVAYYFLQLAIVLRCILKSIIHILRMLSDATYAEQKPFLSHHEDTGGGEILETRKGHSIFWKLGLHAVLFVVQIGLMALNVALLWRNNAAALDYQRNHENFDQTYFK